MGFQPDPPGEAVGGELKIRIDEVAAVGDPPVERTDGLGTMPLWPNAGMQLGLSRNGTYDAARRGEIPTVRFGKKLVVPVDRFERLLAGDGIKRKAEKSDSEFSGSQQQEGN